jgi:hypothetical protein
MPKSNDRQQLQIWFVGGEQMKMKRNLDLESFNTGVPRGEIIRESISIRNYIKKILDEESSLAEKTLLDLVKKHFEK